jgi:hypothetical protein
MAEAGGDRAGKALSGARTSAELAMEAAAAIGHGGLAAAAAGGQDLGEIELVLADQVVGAFDRVIDEIARAAVRAAAIRTIAVGRQAVQRLDTETDALHETGAGAGQPRRGQGAFGGLVVERGRLGAAEEAAGFGA